MRLTPTVTLTVTFAVISAAAVSLAPSPARAAPARLKELTDLQGFRDNELYGYGLVVGLAGSGDSERVLFTSQSMSGMLGRLGVRVDPKDVRARNVAAVIVTGRLTTFARPGSRLDVTVSSIGNARSLSGGTLLLTPLAGADGVVYALAQGAVQTGGFEAGGRGTMLRKNQPNTGRVPQGATVERAVVVDLTRGPLVLQLKQPDFTTASRIAATVEGALGAGSARALDAAAVEVKLPEGMSPVTVVAQLEAIEVDADVRARVVVSERTGTIVAGERVRLRPAAVSHGSLSVSINERPVFSQPGPLSQGTSYARPVADVAATETGAGVAELPASTTVSELARALNALGASPRDLISILQALKAAGALDGELEVI